MPARLHRSRFWGARLSHLAGKPATPRKSNWSENHLLHRRLEFRYEFRGECPPPAPAMRILIAMTNPPFKFATPGPGRRAAVPVRCDGGWRSLVLPGLAFLLLAAAAAGQPAVINGDAVRPFFDLAKTMRVDMVGIGDSNQLQRSNGWDEGWHKALERRYGIYATGVVSFGEASGGGAGSGFGYESMPSIVNGGFAYNGAPASADAYLNSFSSGLVPLNYLYVPSGQSVATRSIVGFLLRDNSQLPLNGPLRFHFSYGLFSGSGAGSFQPFMRYESHPFDTVFTGPVVTTRTGDASAFRVATGSISLTASAARTRGFSLRPAPMSGGVVGPFIGYYVRCESQTRQTGAAMNTLYARGSQSLRDVAAALQASSDQTLSLFFSSVRATQGETKAVLIRINSGLNDRSETEASIARGFLPGSSAAAYEDNLQFIISKIRGTWAQNGWPADELYFLLTPSHPVAEPDENGLRGYRSRAEAVALANPRTCAIRLDKLTNAPEMLANIWYQLNGFDRNHLTDDAYFALAERELLSIVRPSCVSDFNSDGGVDGQDVAEFFGSWTDGDFIADVNNDGGVDGRDVGSFFDQWSISAC